MSPDNVQRRRDGQAVCEMTPEHARQGLLHVEGKLGDVNGNLKALYEARASMIAKGERHAGKARTINENILREEARREHLESIRQEYRNRLEPPLDSAKKRTDRSAPTLAEKLESPSEYPALSIEEVCQVFQKSKATIYRWVEEKTLTCTHVSGRIQTKSVLRLLRAKRN